MGEQIGSKVDGKLSAKIWKKGSDGEKNLTDANEPELSQFTFSDLFAPKKSILLLKKIVIKIVYNAS